MPASSCSARCSSVEQEGAMASARKLFAKADIPDIHAESVEELREAFDLFDTKGAGK